MVPLQESLSNRYVVFNQSQEIQMTKTLVVLLDDRNNKATIRLWARDFYDVIADEATGRINYRLVEIETVEF